MVEIPTAASSYSKTQVWLHWAVAAMILVQFVFPDGMQHAWRAFRRSQEVASGDMPLAYMHIVLGIAVLVLAAWRLGLRFKLGAPPPPPGEHPALRLLAAAVQTIIYALIFIVPISGLVAWFGGVRGAAQVHVLGQNVLLYLVLLHAAGALVQHFVLRTDVLRRMLAFRQA